MDKDNSGNEDLAADLAGTRTGEDAGTGGSGETTVRASVGGTPPPAGMRADIANDDDIGRIGGGQTGGISTGDAGTGTAGSGIGSGGTGGAEPTDTGSGLHAGTEDIGTDVGGSQPSETGLSNVIAGQRGRTDTAGLGGTGAGQMSTRGGSGIGSLSGGTGDIGGLGGSAVGESGSTGTEAVGGVGGGPGTLDEGEIGSGGERA
jgi:hypothetical protein